MIREPLKSGQLGKFRVRFTDEYSDPVEATNVSVSIWEANTDPDIDLPIASGLTPDYLGFGVYQLEYTPVGIAGTWYDEWTGEIYGLSTTSRASFQVIEGGHILPYPTLGPIENNVIEVILPSGVMSIDGSVLSEDYSFLFTTTYCPLYADDNKLRLIAGGILNSAPQITLLNALLEASLEADALTFLKGNNSALFLHARREYTACRAALILGQNILAAGGILQSKELSDFKVAYNTDVLFDLIKEMMSICRRWEEQLMAGGLARTLRDAQVFVKGAFDPDRPQIGRDWREVQSNQLPIGNIKNLHPGERRYKTTSKYRYAPGSTWKKSW